MIPGTRPLRKLGRNSNIFGGAKPVISVDSTREKLLKSHISHVIRKTYNAALKQFLSYCNGYRKMYLPASESTVLNHIFDFFTISYATARVYSSAVRNFHLESDLRDPTNHFYVTRAVKGYARLRIPGRDRREPIKISHLKHFKKRSASSSIPPCCYIGAHLLWLFRISASWRIYIHHQILFRKRYPNLGFTIVKYQLRLRIEPSKTDQ